MEYCELRPSPELWDDVVCIWYDDRLQREQLVLPDGCIDIVWIKGHKPSIAGPATLPITAPLSNAPVLGLRFRPGTAPAFLGVPADAMLNCDVDLEELWPEAAKRLADELDRASTIDEGLALLQQTAAEQRKDASDELVAAAVSTLRRAPDTQVAELGDTLGISERQLLRRFTNAVGYGPKVLGRVLRFQRFMRLLEAPEAQHWDLARLAAEAGYADHAHLTRECARLSGSVPSALRGGND
ncbi:MAG TPA: helix-turn-helix domain-containing protein [Chloroflexota bacterium]